jgi:hypothetical protein
MSSNPEPTSRSTIHSKGHGIINEVIQFFDQEELNENLEYNIKVLAEKQIMVHWCFRYRINELIFVMEKCALLDLHCIIKV